MANPDEGEVGFTAGGKEWTLSYPNRTLRAIEKKLRKPIGKVLADLQSNTSVEELQVIFFHGLRTHHNDVTEEVAADLVMMGKMMKFITEGISLAMGGPEDGEKGNGAARPPEPSQQPSTGSAT